jgi:glutathione synthase/RimK-type ligase-like ATP-grasp enzyme
MKRIEAIILCNEIQDDHLLWVNACNNHKEKVNFKVVNLTLNNWLDEIQKQSFDILLAKPGGVTAPFKQLFDERIYILNKVLGYHVFPSADEIFIYENKRFLSYWLKANKIPHPRTDVFSNRKEAEDFIQSQGFPLIAKVNIGASGSGVRILKSTDEAMSYIRRTFSGKGAPRRSGPNLSKGGLIKRGIHYLFHPHDLKGKLDLYKSIASDLQTNFVIFQEYIEHTFEWRVVRIGDSFFAHKKLKIGEKASGSLVKNYENPPLALLDFARGITEKYQFYSQAVDVFESDRGYLVNEMQCIFGQSDPFQMKVNDKIGRYRYINGKWEFEEGDFARNGCYDLRLEFVLNKF